MQCIPKGFIPFLLILFAFSMVDFTCLTDDAEARSRFGGRSFSRSRTTTAPSRTATTTRPSTSPRSGGFMRGMAGGLLGGAIGSMLFGGLAHGGVGGGFGGSGIGLFQILIMAGIGYFIYKRFFKKRSTAYGHSQSTFMANSQNHASTFTPPPPPGAFTPSTMADGIAMIRQSEPDFDPEHFKEIAQDVFFQVQAGWMRRDIQSYKHLLGQRLIQEYEEQFSEMRQKGHLNKLENIAVRSVELVDAGVDGSEEFVSVLFTANLLDYTVNENDGSLVEGSMTSPVKFAEKWTWARPIGAEVWKLEGITIQE